MKKTLLLIAAIFLSASYVYSQNVRLSGVVVDAETKAPAEFANVRLQTLSDSTFIKGSTTDNKGRFRLTDIQSGDYRLIVSMLGYIAAVTELKGLTASTDLYEIQLVPETIQLDDVTITASGIVNQTDRKVIFPTQEQVKMSTNGVNLLQRMMLPRISVNSITNAISTDEPGGLQLRVNGVQVSSNEVMAIPSQEILRIEFLENPGLRYGNTAIVINYITRRHESGGAAMVDFMQSPHIMFGNHQASGKLNYKKSEFGVYYNLFVRDFYEYWRENEETFRFEDGEILKRSEIGQPGRFNRIAHSIGLNYNYKPSEKAYFNVSFGYLDDGYPHNDFQSILLNSNEPNKRVEMKDFSETKNRRPAIDLYYMQSLKKKQTLVLNVVGTYNETENSRMYQEAFENKLLTDVSSQVKGEKYSFIGEGIYEKQFNTGRLSAGIKHTQAQSNNVYGGNIENKTKMNQSDTYAYTEYQGKVKKFNYSVGLGFDRSWLKQEGKDSYETYTFRPNLSLRYAFTPKIYARLNARIENISPSLGELGAVEQLIDSIQIRRGNPTISPYKQYWTDFYLEWRIGKKVTLSNRSYYINQPHAIMPSIYREDNMFVHTYENQERWQKLNSNITLRVAGLWNFLHFTLTGGLTHCISDGNDYSHRYTNWNYRGNVMGIYKNAMLIFEITNNHNDLRGEQIRGGENMHSLMGMYKFKNVSVALGVLNPFMNNFKVKNDNLNQYASVRNTLYTNESSRAIILKFSWNFQFGRKYNTGQKRTNNTDTDTGIMSSGKGS